MVNVAKQYLSPDGIEYYGFDTFQRENQLSKVKKKLSKTGCKFKLYSRDSTDVLPGVVDRLSIMDLIFIDGDHSHVVAKSDWENSKALIDENTGVFFHNYNYSGPKKVVQNISEEEYEVEIINPSQDYKTAYEKTKK